jgi:hypothetical protein
MADNPALQLGESWAYRARQSDELAEVRVVRFGSQRPARVLVLFVDDRFEGRQEWVPPARLKVLWENVGEFRQREERWSRVYEAGIPDDDARVDAAEQIMELLLDYTQVAIMYREAGAARICDPDVLGRTPCSQRRSQFGRGVGCGVVGHDAVQVEVAELPDVAHVGAPPVGHQQVADAVVYLARDVAMPGAYDVHPDGVAQERDLGLHFADLPLGFAGAPAGYPLLQGGASLDRQGQGGDGEYPGRDGHASQDAACRGAPPGVS